MRKSMQIIIADDDSVLRWLLRASLTRVGHEVIEVADGKAAWEIIQRERIQLVITDWVMPSLDGVELIRRIRAANIPTYTYIILLTAKSEKEEIIEGLEAGADDYLTKPFDPGEMLARVAIGERILNLETRLREYKDQLEILATHDSLTGLLNRRATYQHAEQALLLAEQEATSLSLILLDVDHFKAINDQYGHLSGDQALRLVAETILQATRPQDFVGRWGGEEFVLVLPKTSLAEAEKIAEKIRQKMATTTLVLPEGDVRLFVSLGLTSSSPKNPCPLDTLVQQADQALYCAKRQGRNCVRLFNPLSQLPEL